MQDNYKISLEILYQLLKESNNSYWANWIAKDIRLWDSNKDVKSHLSAYGGMGSINDLYIGDNDKLGIWKDEVFDVIKNLSWSLAKKRINKAPLSIDFYKYGTGQMVGSRCRDCGNGRLDEDQVENYLVFEYLPKIIVQLIKENRLHELLPITSWIDKSEIKSDRNKILNLLRNSKIENEKSMEWLKRCPKCGGNNTCLYRWEYDEKKEAIIESNDNLKIKKT